MSRYARIAPEIKEQILHRIRTDGIPVADVSREHGVSTVTIYSWLSSSAMIPPNILQINKLKRENEELKRLLGQAMLMNERSKKNQSRHGL